MAWTQNPTRRQDIAIELYNRGYGQLDLSTRFFRLVVDSGLADNPFAATIRSVA